MGAAAHHHAPPIQPQCESCRCLSSRPPPSIHPLLSGALLLQVALLKDLVDQQSALIDQLQLQQGPERVIVSGDGDERLELQAGHTHHRCTFSPRMTNTGLNTTAQTSAAAAAVVLTQCGEGMQGRCACRAGIWSVHAGQALECACRAGIWSVLAYASLAPSPEPVALPSCRHGSGSLAHSHSHSAPPPPLLHATCLRTFTRMDYDNLPDRLILIRYDSLAGWRGSYQNGLLCPGWLYQGPWGGVWSGKPVILGMNSYYAPG